MTSSSTKKRVYRIVNSFNTIEPYVNGNFNVDGELLSEHTLTCRISNRILEKLDMIGPGNGDLTKAVMDVFRDPTCEFWHEEKG